MFIFRQVRNTYPAQFLSLFMTFTVTNVYSILMQILITFQGTLIRYTIHETKNKSEVTIFGQPVIKQPLIYMEN